MRRERIPCLAYLRDIDVSDPEARSFRSRVAADLVVVTYRDLCELRALLERDLCREIDAQYPAAPGASVISSPPTHSGTFVGRDVELAALLNAIDQSPARIGVWGR